MNLYNWKKYNLNESLFNTTIIEKLKDKLSQQSYDDFREKAIKAFDEYDIESITNDDIEIVYPSEFRQLLRSDYNNNKRSIFFGFKDDYFMGTQKPGYSPGNIEDSDLILYIDLTNKADQTVNTKRVDRRDSRQGILNPAQAKAANMERYRKIIMDRIGLSDKESMVLNYKSIIEKIMTKETAFTAIILHRNNFANLLKELNKIIRYINDDDDGVDNCVENAKKIISLMFDSKKNTADNLAHNKKIIAKSEIANFNFQHVLKLSNMVYDYAINYDVRTVYDMNNVFNKFEQIYKTYNDSVPTRSLYVCHDRTDNFFYYILDEDDSYLRNTKFTDSIIQESSEYLTSVLR